MTGIIGVYQREAGAVIEKIIDTMIASMPRSQYLNSYEVVSVSR